MEERRRISEAVALLGLTQNYIRSRAIHELP